MDSLRRLYTLAVTEMLGISVCQLSQLRAKEVMLPVTAQMKRVSGCHREHLEQLQCVSSHTLSFIRMQMYCLYLIPLNLPFLKMSRLLNALKILQQETLWGCLQPSYQNVCFELLSKITHLSNNLHTCHISSSPLFLRKRSKPSSRHA